MLGKSLSHYKITSKLGEGGMGVVWRAEDTNLGREVALKVLPEAFTADPERLARFEREARVLASLNHPHIAAIHGLEEAGGQRFLVLELAEGETLAKRLEQGPLPLDKALEVARQVAEALEAAHEKGVVHRDLKPGNINLTPDGQVKVLDFGLAKALETDGGRRQVDLTHSPTLTQHMTEAGVLMGTAAYMSPEQARGESADRRADVWAFGVLLMEMLTGSGVYAGKTVTDTLAGILAREPRWDELPADTPPGVRRLLERCLEKEVRDRLQAIGEARIAIERLQAGDGGDAAASATAAAAPATLRRVLPWALFAAAALGALGLWLRPSPHAAPPETLRLEVALADEPLFSNLGAAVVPSPDGRYLAYVLGDGSQMSLHIRRLDQLDDVEISGGTADFRPYHPFFSPDGQWVGFVTPTALRKVPLAGGTPITLAPVNFSRGASWAPDGTIVFAPEPGVGLSRIRADGGEVSALTTLDESAGEATHRWPQVLPDGRHVLFTSHTNTSGAFDDATLQTVDLESGERKLIHRGGYYGRYLPTGHLAFINRGTVFVIAADPETLETHGSALPLIQGIASNPGEGAAQFAFSQDGKLIYLHGAGAFPTYPIEWVDRFGRATPLLSEPGTYASPALSPDGSRLALSIVRDDNWDVWVYDLERNVSTRLTFHDGYDADQVWSPDGRYLVFSSDQDGDNNLYRKRADGSGELEQLTPGAGGGIFPTSWSSDGRWIAGQRLGQAEDIWLLDLQEGDGQIRDFLATPYGERAPDFSPNGRWLAYSSNESGRSEVYVRPLGGGGGKWQVSDGGGGMPRWSGDGRQLYYRTSEGLMSSAVEDSGDTIRFSRPRVVFEGSYQGGAIGMSIGAYTFDDYDVSADGERFVMFPAPTEQSRGARVILTTNWFAEVGRVASR